MSQLGILSLAEDPCSMPMWAHYGDNHAGVAIGFPVIDGTDLANPNYCAPVRYSDEIEPFDFSAGHLSGVAYFKDERGGLKAESYISLKDEQLQRAIFRKTTPWAYEKEWRYVRNKGGLFDVPAPITEVVFGLRCKQETKNAYREIATKHIGSQIDFKEVILHPSNQLGIRTLS